MSIRIVAVTLATSAVVVDGGLAFLGWQLNRRHDLPLWIESVSTAMAVVAAVVAAVYAASAFGLEGRREERFQESQRRAQAALIAAWYDVGIVEHVNIAWKPVRTEPSPGFYLRNASDVPVNGVYVRFTYRDHHLGKQHVPVLPPSAEPTFYEFDELVQDRLNDLLQRDLVEYGGATNDLPIAHIRFDDAAGVSWVRSPGSGLQEV